MFGVHARSGIRIGLFTTARRLEHGFALAVVALLCKHCRVLELLGTYVQPLLRGERLYTPKAVGRVL